MYKTASETINKYNMLQKGDTILAGASGGADSTALLHFLTRLRDEYELKLCAVYVNHRIRGEEAYEDAHFAEELCSALNVEFFYEEADVPEFARANRISEEEAGRILRYRIFNEILEKKGGGKIALGHNLNDNAETVLIRLARGTGPKGLEGIPPVRDNIIRPLIECSRELIEKYCAENDLEFKTDSTNLMDIYSRNKIRLGVMPVLAELNPNAAENILNTANLIKEENSYIEKMSGKAYTSCVLKDEGGKVSLDLGKLRSFDDIILKNVLRKAVLSARGSLKDISSAHIDILSGLMAKGTGKSVSLPGIRAEISYGKLNIHPANEEKKSEPFCVPLEINSTVRIENIQKKIILELKNKKFDKNEHNLYTKTFNYDKIKGSLEFRTRKSGDFIRIKGAESGKSLKKYFIDSKIPVSQRDSIPLVACGSDILWICGWRISDYYKADENTLNLLFITLEDDS